MIPRLARFETDCSLYPIVTTTTTEEPTTYETDNTPELGHRGEDNAINDEDYDSEESTTITTTTTTTTTTTEAEVDIVEFQCNAVWKGTLKRQDVNFYTVRGCLID